ncbi:MAG TPA: caspase family protein [Blastocatellia bacterium]|nr:caspase family protein [Blastocatellia bacterium]
MRTKPEVLAPGGSGRQWAVVIGVSEYRNLAPESQLRYADRDAEDIAAFIRSPEGGGFPSNQIKVLVNQDASLFAMRTALGTWLPRSSEPDDIVYVFFAGHGAMEGDDGYLLAYDSDPQNLYATALPIAELDSIIAARVRARGVVLIADACHSGKIGWTRRGLAERLLINRYLEEVGKAGAGVFRLLASRADERSYEDIRWGGGHGVFTHCLLEGLKGKADLDGDGFVRVAELIDYLSRVVPEETMGLQHPRAAGSIDGQMPLAVVDPELGALESSLIRALEEIGQQAIDDYMNCPTSMLRADLFKRGAAAFARLKQLCPADQRVESKRLFCEGRALIAEDRIEDAIARLEKCVALDATAPYAWNALGVAYERDNNVTEAAELFARAARLAPGWVVPRLHLGLQYRRAGEIEKAGSEFKAAELLNPAEPLSRLMLAGLNPN